MQPWLMFIYFSLSLPCHVFLSSDKTSACQCPLVRWPRPSFLKDLRPQQLCLSFVATIFVNTCSGALELRHTPDAEDYAKESCWTTCILQAWLWGRGKAACSITGSRYGELCQGSWRWGWGARRSSQSTLLQAQPLWPWQGSWLLCGSPRTSSPITCLFSKVLVRWVPPRALYSRSRRRIRIRGGETRRGRLLGSRGEETAQKHGDHCTHLGPTIWVSRGRDLTRPPGRSGGRREDLGKVSDKSWVALAFCLNTTSQAAMGIAHLLVMALEKEGVPKAEATRKIWMVDSKGLIVKVLSVWRPAVFLRPATSGRGLEEIFQGANCSDRIESRRTAVSQSPQMTHPPGALTTLVQKLWMCVRMCLPPAPSLISPLPVLHSPPAILNHSCPKVTCSPSSPSLHILFLCLERMPTSFPTSPLSPSVSSLSSVTSFKQCSWTSRSQLVS